MAALNRLLAAASFCGAFALTAAWAQSVDVKGDTAGQTALTERGVKTDGSNGTAGAATPVDQKADQKVASKAASKGGEVIMPKPARKAAANTLLSESGVAPHADVKDAQGPDAQAVRSAESTARNTVYDPDDQIRSNSTAGNTQPVPGAAPMPDQAQTEGATADAETQNEVGTPTAGQAAQAGP